jgi:hypothetical protein
MTGRSRIAPRSWIVAALAGLALAPLAARAATYDLTGVWRVTTTNHEVVGVCPPGFDSVFEATIRQQGDVFSMDLEATPLSGPCLPAAVCSFAGTVSGASYLAQNSVVVDDEGGVAATTLPFEATSATQASGSAVSTYTLDEFVCTWSYDVDLLYLPEPGGGALGLAAFVALARRARQRCASSSSRVRRIRATCDPSQ